MEVLNYDLFGHSNIKGFQITAVLKNIWTTDPEFY